MHARRRIPPGLRRGGVAVVALVALAVAALLLVRGPDEARASPRAKVAPNGQPLVLTFEENFDTLRLFDGKTGVWRTTYGSGKHKGLDRRSLPTNRERQIYVDPFLRDAAGPIGINPFKLRDGVLSITARRTPSDLVPRLNGYRYTSGLITTQPSFDQTYGYFEMRARVPKGKGLWPAFWLLPADHSWPPELDVMESIGNPSEVYMTAHSKSYKRKKPDAEKARVEPGKFHVYGVSWDRDELIWTIDGKVAARRPTPPDMHKPMFMLANLAVGGYWPGEPDETTPLPATFDIDYIRAYRFAR